MNKKLIHALIGAVYSGKDRCYYATRQVTLFDSDREIVIYNEGDKIPVAAAIAAAKEEKYWEVVSRIEKHPKVKALHKADVFYATDYTATVEDAKRYYALKEECRKVSDIFFPATV